MAEILILTGAIKSGKTTRLMQWAASQKNIDGIFQPVIEYKRFIYHVSSRTLKQLENDQTENITTIGKYNFSNETFKWAKNILVESFKKDLEYLIIDEVGPLELEGKGLEKAISYVFKNTDSFKGKIVFVVRENLLDKFVEHYHIQNKYKLFLP